jgi:NAD(P)-dependent dehydrogenase (short-subunit alcohol dehydrogenase family)
VHSVAVVAPHIHNSTTPLPGGNMSDKVWVITGTSRGLGREWAIAAVDRGDSVAATALNTDSLVDLVER